MAGNRDIALALHSLDDVLRHKKGLGVDTVQVGEDALTQLRGLSADLSQRVPAAGPISVSLPVSVEAPAAKASLADILGPTASAVASPVLKDADRIDPQGETRREKLNNIFRLAKACDVCRGLGTLREAIVFASGNPEAELMFVGEAPGEDEEKLKKPFVGPGGKKLDQIIKAMGVNRDDVYFSNIVKFRPMKGDPRFQASGNRKPTPNEMAVSVKYVLAEIQVVQPKSIVVLGGTAAEGLLGVAGSVGRMRNQFYDLNGIPAMVTYHPDYLLRQDSEPDKAVAMREKRKVWEDMLLVMEKMGLPISDAQRGYFA